MSNSFIEWLDEQEKKNGLTDYKIAQRGKFSHSALSRARSGIPPGYDICGRIAEALNVSPMTVFSKAGLVPDMTIEQIWAEDWKNLLSKLMPEEQAELRQIALLKIENRKRAAIYQQTDYTRIIHDKEGKT